jgi:AraC-like DNA-binding protein
MADHGTVCVWAARPAVFALRARGIDEAPALRTARLSASAIENVEARLPFVSVTQLWDAAASATGDPLFGIHVAATVPPGSCDVLEYLGSSSATLGEAYERITRYIRIFYDRSNFQLIVEPRHARLVGRHVVPAAQYAEFLCAYLVGRGRQWTGIQWTPERVSFQHPCPAGRDHRLAVFGAPVKFSAAEIEIRLPTKVLSLPQRNADSRLLDILTRYASAQLSAMPDRGDIVARAAASITRRIASVVPTLSSTSASLKMNPRTLQRRLAEKGLTHSVLLDQIRRGLALKYIVDAGLSVHEIAYLLQFSDATAFARAFKRWTGETPLEYRKRGLVAS